MAASLVVITNVSSILGITISITVNPRLFQSQLCHGPPATPGLSPHQRHSFSHVFAKNYFSISVHDTPIWGTELPAEIKEKRETGMELDAPPPILFILKLVP